MDKVLRRILTDTFGGEAVVGGDFVEVQLVGFNRTERGMVDYVRHAASIPFIRAYGDMTRVDDDDVARLKFLGL